MSIKLNGSSAGSVSFDAPADTSPTGTDVTLTLPTSAGSAGQYLRNSSTAGTLEFATVGSFTSYAIICDEKAHNVDGGTFTSGAWRTRDLNTTIADPDSIVSIASNQFTLGAGSYLIEASAPALDCARHQARLYNVTTATVVQYGQNSYSNQTYPSNDSATLFARITIASSTTFEIQHRCEVTQIDYSFGIDNSFGGTSIYTVVKIFKEA